MTPGGGPSREWIESAGLPWAADNGAYSGFDAGAYVRMLDRIAGRRPLWVTAPDVVGDARATLDLFGRWHHEIASRGLPAALVAQDGLK